LDIRLAAAVASDAGALLPRLFQPSPVPEGTSARSVCCCSCRRSPAESARTCCFVRQLCMWESGSSSHPCGRAAEPLPVKRPSF